MLLRSGCIKNSFSLGYLVLSFVWIIMRSILRGKDGS